MKFFFTLICIFLLLRWLFKPVLRLVLQSVLGKMVKNQQGSFYKTYTASDKKRSGSIDVDFTPPKKSSPSPHQNTGEYIDYEEVK